MADDTVSCKPSKPAVRYGLVSPNTTSVVPGRENGVSWPPAAMATISRPLAVVNTRGVARALVGN